MIHVSGSQGYNVVILVGGGVVGKAVDVGEDGLSLLDELRQVRDLLVVEEEPGQDVEEVEQEAREHGSTGADGQGIVTSGGGGGGVIGGRVVGGRVVGGIGVAGGDGARHGGWPCASRPDDVVVTR